MPDYRLYRLDPHSGHFTGVEQISADDDVEAVCLTNLRLLEEPAELWRGGHKVARFDARPEPAASPPRHSQSDESPPT